MDDELEDPFACFDTSELEGTPSGMVTVEEKRSTKAPVVQVTCVNDMNSSAESGLTLGSPPSLSARYDGGGGMSIFSACKTSAGSDDPVFRKIASDKEEMDIRHAMPEITTGIKDIFCQCKVYTDIEEVADKMTEKVRTLVEAKFMKHLPEYEMYANVLVLNSNGYLRETHMTNDTFGFRKVELNWISGENDEERAEFGRILVSVRAVVVRLEPRERMDPPMAHEQMQVQIEEGMSNILASRFKPFQQYDDIPGVLHDDASEVKRMMVEVSGNIKSLLGHQFPGHDFFVTTFAINNYGYCQERLLPSPSNAPGATMLQSRWFGGRPEDKNEAGRLHVFTWAAISRRSFSPVPNFESRGGACRTCCM